MGNFYGNITDTNRVQFYFDKFYSTKKSLQEHSLQDGIYIGRYVLVEYNLNPFEDDKLINLNASALIPQEKCIAYKNENGNIILILYEAGEEINRHSIKTLTAEEEKNEDLKSEFNHKINYWIDNLFYPNNPIQGGDPGVLRGWDSTVWQKVFIDASKKNVNYINIAELNALVPKFEIVYSLPGENIKPHVDVPISSLLDYKIRTSVNWDFTIDNDKDINFNELGFNVEQRIYDTSSENFIKFIKESSNKSIYSAEGSQELITGEDRQRLKINLPILGNTIAKIWDIIYGYDNKEIRNTLSSWADEKNKIDKEGFYLGEGDKSYNPEDLNSVNGCLKTFYNLFGYDIVTISSLPNTKDIDINQYNKNIYYVNNKYFYLSIISIDENGNSICQWDEIKLYSLIKIILEFNQILGVNDPKNLNSNTIFGAINVANRTIKKTEEQGIKTESQGNIAEQQGNVTKQQGIKAEQQGNTAEQQGSTAKQQGDKTEQQGNIAEGQGNKAKSQSDIAKKLIGTPADQAGNTIYGAIYLANKAADNANSKMILWEKF